MSDILALDHFKCTGCGATAEWNPAKRYVSCPYCGTACNAAVVEGADTVAEIDLDSTLQLQGEEPEGWDAITKSVRCQSCNAVSVFMPEHQANRCEFCGSPALVDESSLNRTIRPTGILPFIITNAQVRESIRQWYGAHFWAPNNLKTKALTDTVHGIYIPYWTFDAHVECDWSGDKGTHVSSTDSDGNTSTSTSWEPKSGSFQQFFDDALVPASKGVHPKLIFEVEPFPTTTDLQPYSPRFLSGWIAEQYQVDLKAAVVASQERMDAALHEKVKGLIGGDEQRRIQIEANFSDRTFKHVLLPIWLLHYNYRNKTYQVIVNGSTGKIAGEYPISVIKVISAVILSLIGLALLFYVMDFQE